jgi:hypothetical protein
MGAASCPASPVNCPPEAFPTVQLVVLLVLVQGRVVSDLRQGYQVRAVLGILQYKMLINTMSKIFLKLKRCYGQLVKKCYGFQTFK